MKIYGLRNGVVWVSVVHLIGFCLMWLESIGCGFFDFRACGYWGCSLLNAPICCFLYLWSSCLGDPSICQYEKNHWQRMKFANIWIFVMVDSSFSISCTNLMYYYFWFTIIRESLCLMVTITRWIHFFMYCGMEYQNSKSEVLLIYVLMEFTKFTSAMVKAIFSKSS